MTDISRWLVGLVAISVASLLFYLIRTMNGQVRSGEIASKSTRIAGSMTMWASGVLLFLVAALTSQSIQPLGAPNYVIWCAWAAWWVGALLGVAAIGRVGPTLALNVLWTIGIIFWRFQ